MHESKRRRESRSDVLGDVLSECFREYTLVYSLQTVEKLLRGSCQRGRSPSDYIRIDRLCRSGGAFSATPKTLPAVSGEKDRCRRAFLTSFREYTLVYSLRLSKKPLGGIGGPQPSDFGSETGGVYVGFGCLAQQGFPYALCRPASRRRAGKECSSAEKIAVRRAFWTA